MNKELSPNSTLLHYLIVSKVGAGRMGQVYSAQDTPNHPNILTGPVEADESDGMSSKDE